MSDLNAELQTLSNSWSDSLKVLKGNPDIVEATVPGVSIEQIDETVKTLIDWASRVRAPQGFRPIYPIIKIQLAASLKKLAQQAQNLKADPATHFPAFMAQIVQCFAPITAAVTFSEKNEGQKIVAELGGELSQHIALINTAQTELNAKLEVLKKTEKSAAEITDQAVQAEADATAIKKVITSLEGDKETAATHLKAIHSASDEIETAKEGLTTLEKQNLTLNAKLEEQSKQLQTLMDKTLAQQELIDELLPKGTSAGLANAFNKQRMRFGRSQVGWAVAFLASVGMLIAFAWQIKAGLPSVNSQDVWAYLLYRIPLATPMIWLGWFSAIQYGNVLRLKEDYAFKEATSMAFAGYRNHMEHLGGISEADGSNALNKLALVTISILGSDPLRLLQGQASDASPIEKLSALFKSE
jgi:uncharacterized membrane protein